MMIQPFVLSLIKKYLTSVKCQIHASPYIKQKSYSKKIMFNPSSYIIATVWIQLNCIIPKSHRIRGLVPSMVTLGGGGIFKRWAKRDFLGPLAWGGVLTR